ncbi:DLH domain-containing protein [Citrus sinensis]|uniref:DLH domain-containing protein n=1 Tax=Citrus sinensis TaxID=2711 RepID=A0ACB8I7L3_CITSI|nr:DLH domain-containing protein [Citrus sinensis]
MELILLTSLLLNIASSQTRPQAQAPCYREPPTFCPTCGAGTVTELGGLKAYVTGPPHSKKAVLMISDIYGDEPPIYRYVDQLKGTFYLLDRLRQGRYHLSCLELAFRVAMRELKEPNAIELSLTEVDLCNTSTTGRFAYVTWVTCLNILLYRSVADKVAGAGFLVVAPDFFHGDAANPSNPKYDKDTWRKNHTTDKGYEDAKPVIAALKEKGVSAVGAAGFCWGGKVAVKLASNQDVQAAVLLHPSNVTEDEIKVVKVPIAVLGAERDNGLPPAQMKRFDEILYAKPKFDHLVKTYPGVCHGWTVRYFVNDTFAVNSAAEAHEDMINCCVRSLFRAMMRGIGRCIEFKGLWKTKLLVSK